MTINKALTLLKAIRARTSSLEQLRETVANRETYYAAKEKTIEPQYDVKLVDKKITELNKMSFDLDSAIKASNSTVLINDLENENLVFESLK